MAQRHLDRLTSFDTSFLLNEKGNGHMAIGVLLFGEGPAPSYQECLDRVSRRLHLTPRQRQRLTFPPLWLGTPYWVDYAQFRLEEHVHRVSLPKPGGEKELEALVGELLAPPLDRRRPLWQMWLVDGLADERFALVYRAHHAMGDGLSVLDVVKLLVDGVEAEEAPISAWKPSDSPSRLYMTGRALGGVLKTLSSLLSALRRGRRHPLRSLRGLGRALAGLWSWIWIDPPTRSPLNVEIGPRRSFLRVGRDLAVFKQVKNELGGTVNDVALSVVAGALRRWLLQNGGDARSLHLRALVPVSIRAEEEQGNLGNRLAAMRGPLPIQAADPVERLRLVSAEMEELKRSRQAFGAEVLWGVNDWFREFAPPLLLAVSAIANFTTRYFNLLVTNFPGPPAAVSILGREVSEAYPIGFLAKRHALSVAIFSYNGMLHFGLLADPEAIEGVEQIAGYIEEEIDELATAAAKSAAAPRSGAAARSEMP